MGKAVARNSKQALAKECLKQPETKEYILRSIAVLIRNEQCALTGSTPFYAVQTS